MTAGTALADADANLGTPALAAEPVARRPADSLVQAFTADAPGAFEAVVEAYEARIARLAHRLLGWQGRSDVEDVVQDVFFAAYQHRRRFGGRASLTTWLTAITVNRCRSQQRRWRLRRIFLRSFQRDAAPTDVAASDRPESSEGSAKVRSAVQALPARDREVIVLRYFEGLDAAEIAGVTKQSKNAVEVRLHRARARLAAALGAWHREEGS